jgi:hypothetical protein
MIVCREGMKVPIHIALVSQLCTLLMCHDMRDVISSCIAGLEEPRLLDWGCRVNEDSGEIECLSPDTPGFTRCYLWVVYLSFKIFISNNKVTATMILNLYFFKDFILFYIILWYFEFYYYHLYFIVTIYIISLNIFILYYFTIKGYILCYILLYILYDIIYYYRFLYYNIPS